MVGYEGRFRELSYSTKHNIHIIGLPEEKEREKGAEVYLRNNSWKHPESGEGNRNPDPVDTENSQQDRQKQANINTCCSYISHI